MRAKNTKGSVFKLNQAYYILLLKTRYMMALALTKSCIAIVKYVCGSTCTFLYVLCHNSGNSDTKRYIIFQGIIFNITKNIPIYQQNIFKYYLCMLSIFMKNKNAPQFREPQHLDINHLLGHHHKKKYPHLYQQNAFKYYQRVKRQFVISFTLQLLASWSSSSKGSS